LSNFADLFKALQDIPDAMNRAQRKAMKRSAAIVMGVAKAKLGTYQSASGAFISWAKLKPETVRRKHLSKTGSGKLSRAGKAYIKKHGSWGAGGNDDSPLSQMGHLRQAITTDFSDISRGVAYVGVAAGSNAEGKGSPSDYAAAHEFGYAPKNLPARPYLRPALEESKVNIREEAAKAITEELRRFGK
jgi:phage gpG-like protein